MAGPSPVELSTDCATCRLEGGVVEVYDPLVPACRFGLPARTRCKLCGAASAGVFDGECARPMREIPANRCPRCEKELLPEAIDSRRCSSCGATASLSPSAEPAPLTSLAELEAALDAWAEREGFADRDALVRATFVESDPTRLLGALSRRAPLEVLADPFANMGVRTTGGPAAAPPPPDRRRPSPARPVAPADATPATSPPATTAPVATAPVAVARIDLPPPPSAPPRAIVYPLVSVIAADGEVHPAELALVDRFLQSEGLPPLAPEEIRVHAPIEVARYVPRERREDVVRLMCESACCDGAPDESEKRVIHAFASAWNVDDEKVDFWLWGYESMNTSLARQLFLKLRRFVLSARWSPDIVGDDE